MVSVILCERGAETSLSEPWFLAHIFWLSPTKALFHAAIPAWFNVLKYSPYIWTITPTPKFACYL